jgi:hypothetical protein
MVKIFTKIGGIRIAYKHPRGYLHQYERDLVEIGISMGIISDTFHGNGWWIISKYNL